MKKKHRDITVDGVVYGWKADCYGEGVTVWKDKKELFYRNFGGETAITPEIVSELIRKHVSMEHLTYNP